ncbi:zinc finger protein 346 isoform X1 [Hippoglossus stenolepis]|uniref:zinc finger protein 346 isoform X1 n=1 Tax=Hippoglossus stenolepis TaxID=195615 RepID=UPI00159C21B4|nr:zinc finger protein 346 isoform X1 [Hippoglossus stenolepis]
MAVAMQTGDVPYFPSGLAEVNRMITENGELFSDSQCKVCNAVLNSQSQKLTHYQSKKHANRLRRYLSSPNGEEPAEKKLKTTSESEDCNNGDRYKACHICNMTFSAPVVAESHYNGKIHAKNLRLKAVGPHPPAVAFQTAPTAQPKKKPADDVIAVAATGGGNNNNDNNNDNPDRFCSNCQASFNNPLMAQQHYVGKKHRKQMTKLKLMETYGPSTAPGSTLKGYPCTVCKIELNSVEQYQSHISGSKHKNQIKKSGQSTTENLPAVEQSHGGNNQVASGDGDQYTAEDDQFAPVDDQYAAGNDQYAPGNDQYAPGNDAGDDRYAFGDDQYTGEVNQYTPEDTLYSEEYQFS